MSTKPAMAAKVRCSFAIGWVVGVVAVGVAGASTAAEKCWPPSTAEAVAVRVLQSELTVAALACGMTEPYAAFVESQADALRGHSDSLIGFYQDAHGETAGQEAVDALVTQLANQASTRKVDWTAGYCDFMRAVTLRAAKTQPSDLGQLAQVQPHARKLLETRACQP